MLLLLQLLHYYITTLLSASVKFSHMRPWDVVGDCEEIVKVLVDHVSTICNLRGLLLPACSKRSDQEVGQNPEP